MTESEQVRILREAMEKLLHAATALMRANDPANAARWAMQARIDETRAALAATDEPAKVEPVYSVDRCGFREDAHACNLRRGHTGACATAEPAKVETHCDECDWTFTCWIVPGRCAKKPAEPAATAEPATRDGWVSPEAFAYSTAAGLKQLATLKAEHRAALLRFGEVVKEKTAQESVGAIRHSQQTTDQCRTEVGSAARRVDVAALLPETKP